MEWYWKNLKDIGRGSAFFGHICQHVSVSGEIDTIKTTVGWKTTEESLTKFDKIWRFQYYFKAVNR